MILASGDPTTDFASPAVWVNLGVAGIFLASFFAGKLHSSKELDRVEAACAAAVATQLQVHADAMQRADDHVRQLLVERDRALAERDEMINVIKDFTLTASAILNKDQIWRGPPPKSAVPRRGEAPR